MVYLAWASNGVAMLFTNIEKNGVKYITLQATFFHQVFIRELGLQGLILKT